MIEAYLQGAMFALTLSFAVGPGLVLQFDASIARGWGAGATVVAGLYSSDVVLMGLGYLGVTRFMSSPWAQLALGGVGVVVLVVMGLSMIVRRPDPGALQRVESGGEPAGPGGAAYRGYFLKAVAVNVTNPFVILFWIGVIGLMSTQLDLSSPPFLAFLLGLYSVAIGLDLTKCFIFSRVGRYFSARVLTWINRSMGAILIVAAVVLVLRLALQRG
jgi:threonine/homoserine/homoserine lactone efflux protein